MNKKEAIQILQDKIKRWQELEPYNPNLINPVFDKWKRITEISIGKIFGNNSTQLAEFKNISYRSNSWDEINPDTLELNIAVVVQSHAKGLDKAKSLLDSFIEEINEFGLSNSNSDMSQEELLLDILQYFHRGAKQLLHRHANRETLKIADEYDVQDLLHAILKLHFDDVRAEFSTPQYAGSNSRIDFILNNHDIAIEVKKTRQNLKDKEIGEELLIDIARYQQSYPKIKTLICFVYDPDGLILNPIGLENDLNTTPSNIKIKAIICPKF